MWVSHLQVSTIEFWGTTSHWLDALSASSDPDSLCQEMGFKTYPQGEDQTVCATVYFS